MREQRGCLTVILMYGFAQTISGTASAAYIITVDENCSGSFVNLNDLPPRRSTPLPCTAALDPTSPTDTPKVPTFTPPPNLPFPQNITPGDVYISGPGLVEDPSDYIRFLPGPNGAKALLFYSDADSDKATQASDIGGPLATIGTPVILAEDIPCPYLPAPYPCNGPPGTPLETVVYNPTSTQPGGLSTDKNGLKPYTYVFLSDCSDTCAVPTPEPSFFSMVAGTILAIFYRHSRRVPRRHSLP